MPTALVCHDDYLLHDNGPFHPERPFRLKAVINALITKQLHPRLRITEARAATPEQVARVHDERYIETVRRMSEQGGGALDVDTPVSHRSYAVALLSAGGALTAMDEVLDGRAANAFIAHRPPGHHARGDHGMGFCLFNNISIAARYAQRERGVERIFILDWDVHHGNGTQEAFYHEPNVFFCSLHQSPWFPFTGEADETGAGDAEGTNLNLPLRAGRRPYEYLELLDDVAAPAMRAFRPDLILVSAGQDCHERDPLGQMRLTTDTFREMTWRVLDLADELCGGRLVVCLEGGYDLDVLADSTSEIIRAMMGEMPPQPTE
ncbi:MAG: histone deacetylase [Armatimonadetes bacterium]|nr:histone deacetylase [Armatimonadota bacterium]